MKRSNQQKNRFLMGFVLLLGVIYSSQGLPLSPTTDIGTKRQGVGYSSSVLPETPSDPGQSNSDESYIGNADPKTPYSSSSDPESALASSYDQPTPPTNSDQPAPPASSDHPAPPASSDQPAPPASSDQPAPPASSDQPAPPASSDQPAPPASSDHPAPPASSDQPAPPASSYQPAPPARSDQQSAPATSSDQPSAPATSSDAQSSPASPSNQQTPSASSDQPAPPASSEQPAPPASSYQPAPPASSYRPAPPARSDQPAPASPDRPAPASSYQPAPPARSDQQSAPATSSDQPSAPATSSDAQSSPASPSNQQTPPASSDQQNSHATADQQNSHATAGQQASNPSQQSSYNPPAPPAPSSKPTVTDQQSKSSEKTVATAPQSTQDQSQSAQHPDNKIQSAQPTQDQSQAAQSSQSQSQPVQSDPAQSQTPVNTSKSDPYYVGNDQTSQTTPQNNQLSGYSNPPQLYDTTQNKNINNDMTTQGNAASSNSPQQNPPDYARYELQNVTSNIVPNTQNNPPSTQAAKSSSPATVNLPSSSLSALGLPGNDSTRYGAVVRQGDDTSSASPVYLSPSDAAKVPDNYDTDATKYPAVSKETTITGNRATTYLELPKHLHKPAIVKYEVQIAPKTKGVPIEQEIAIMPPEGTGGERKPLVLLKQTVTKPTDEKIQIIVPKEDSSLIDSPKVEVKGGHVDEEDVNKGTQMDKNGELGQGQPQGQGESQGQAESQGQSQDQPQGQGQSQGQGPSQGQSQSQGQGQSQSQVETQGFMCDDLPLCGRYNPTICNQGWMTRHCKKLCGLCSPQEKSSPSPNDENNDNNNLSPKHCEYGGVVHQSGETWSPGPCVPKCECQDGFTNCTKVECPDLNCDKPVKRRWKCCPECLPNHETETRCGVDTRGGNAEGLCCVFPFNYRSVDYFTCTTTDSNEPWCSITRNYDRDGLWGSCVAKSKVEQNHTKQTDSDEKSALLLATQLSNAREWRNSSNNQVSDTLKSLPSPLSDKSRESLNEVDMPTAYNGSSESSKTNGNNSQNDDNTTSTTRDSYNQENSEVPKISGLGDLLNPNSGNKTKNKTSDLQVAISSAKALSASSSKQRPSVNSYVDQNAGQQWATGYNDRTSSEAGGVYSNSEDANTRYRSSTGETNTPGEYSSWNQYPQGNPAADSTDNVVPNNIENQTSYEMHPDASTAQYGNNPTSTT